MEGFFLLLFVVGLCNNFIFILSLGYLTQDGQKYCRILIKTVLSKYICKFPRMMCQ